MGFVVSFESAWLQARHDGVVNSFPAQPPALPLPFSLRLLS